jgi:hypothetical protein
VRLLVIRKTEGRFEGLQVFRHCRHSGTCDYNPEEHSRRGVPENVLNSGNTDSLSELVRKETTSKVTVTISV